MTFWVLEYFLQSNWKEMGWEYHQVFISLNNGKTKLLLFNYPKTESQNECFFAITIVQFVSAIIYVMFGVYWY